MEALAEANNNTIDMLYNEVFCKMYRPYYAHESSEQSERIAFLHGMIAASRMAGMNLSDMVVSVSGRTVAEEIEELLNPLMLQG